MKAASILFLTVLGITWAYAPAAYSDDISGADEPTLSDFPEEVTGSMETATPSSDTGGTPRRFITMEQVEKGFGAPAEKMPAVGEPPITRWVYKDYTVYFEHQLVLHTVTNR